MGIKGLKISMIVSISFDTEAMPRLNPQQREQAIGRLHAKQPARVIDNDFNCNVRTIERLRVRYNATNSTNGMTDHAAADHRLQPLVRTG